MSSPGQGPNPDQSGAPLPPKAAASDSPPIQGIAGHSTPLIESSTLQAADVNATGDFGPAKGVKAAGSNRPAPSLKPGQLFGRYRIEKELGRGGMGAVFLAIDSHLDRKVALKVPFFLFGETEELLGRFRREARAMATVHHSNICPVYDVGEIDGQVFLSMAFIEGRTLSQEIKQRGSFPVPVAARWLRTIALAVQKAHEAGVVHRDLKPANVMLTVDDEPIVMDFGLARRSKSGEAELTQKGLLMGSPAYMAPEQVEARHEDVGQWTDVWAMGVMLFQLLTGQRPFKGSSTAAVLGRIVVSEPQSFSKLKCSAPPALEAICRKALAKDITKRYQSAREFADELVRFATDAGGSTSPVESTTPVVASEPESPSVHSHRRRRDPELRQVTIAVFNFELNDASEDAEAGNEMVHAFRQFVNVRVKQFNGVILTSNGQEVLACFGFPVAYEDSAQRAIRAALLVLNDAKKIDRSSPGKLPVGESIWATLHTGEAIAEGIDDGENSVTVIGEARTTAVRLDGIAEPGSVVISAATQHQAGLFFETMSLGPQRVRGIAQPVELFRVIKEAVSRNRIELVDPGNLTPLVGRDTELSVLKDRWEQALEHLGQIVLLIGDAGLGKSRLIREIREHIAATDAVAEPAVIEFRCSQYHQSTGFFPAVEFLSRLLDLERATTAGDRLRIVEHYLSELGLGSPENVTLLANMLSVPADDKYPPLHFTPQRQKELTDELLRKWLRELSKRRPVLFIVEDLHWVDPTTLDLINGLVENFETGRLLSILTFRPEFQTPWRSFPHQTQIALSRLTKRQIAEMIKRCAKRQDVPDSVVQQVAERTDGVPLFIEEFTNLVVESGMLDGSTASGTLVRHAIPATLQDLLIARLDRMESNHDVVQLAAAIGREFSYPLLAAVCELPKDELQTELNKLVRAEVLFQKGRVPDAHFIFKHALIQDAAYRSLLKKRRQQFHQIIAEKLESQFPDVVETQPELLAHHFTEAGQNQRSIHYLHKAGKRAQERSAHRESIRHFEKGLEQLAKMEATPKRDHVELDFQIPLSTAITMAHGWGAPDLQKVHSRARELCARIGPDAPLFHVTWGQWAWRALRSELDQADALSRELWNHAAKLGRDFQLEAGFARVCTTLFRGEFATALGIGKSVLEQTELERCRWHAAFTGQNAACTVRAHLAWALWMAGFPDQALAMAREASEIGKQLKDPFSQAFGEYHYGCIQQHCGMGDGARRSGEISVAIGTEHGHGIWIALGTLCQGSGLVLEGKDIARGADLVKRGIEMFRSSGAILSLSHYFAVQAEAYRAAGQPLQALSAVDEGLFHANTTGERFHQSNLLRLRAELLLQTDPEQRAEAEALFSRAIEAARGQDAKSWELRAAISLYRLWRNESRASEARDRLATIYAAFTEGFETADLREAADLLAIRQDKIEE